MTVATRHREAYESWLIPSMLVLVLRVLFFAIAAVASVLLNPAADASRASLADMWAHYDALHYFEIALHGYASASDPNNTAFFPLYPLLIRAVSSAGFSPLQAGLLISLLGTLIAAAYLSRLANDEIGADAGPVAVLYLLLFPTAVYLCAPYTESTFLAGAVPAFYYAKCGKWGRAGVAAAVATATRVTGVFLLMGLLAEILGKHGIRQAIKRHAWVCLVVGALPLIGYALYLQSLKGDPLNFVTSQHVGWGHTFSSPLNVFVSTGRVFWEGRLGDLPVSTGPRLLWLGEVVAAMVGVGFTAWAVQKREWGYAVYMGSLMTLLLLKGPTYVSIPRYLLGLFPIPLFLAGFTRNRPVVALALLGVLAPAATLGLLIYTRGTSWFY
jgi:hypothetical protein